MSFLFYKREKHPSQYALDGEVLRIKGKFEEALYNFNKAITIDKSNDMYYFSRSKVKFCLNDIDGALADIELAIKIQPSVRAYAILKEEYQFSKLKNND